MANALTPIIVRNQRDLDAVFAGIVADLNRIRMSPLLQDEMRRMEKLHAEYFARQAGPDGTPWAPNAPSTIRRKGHANILRGIPSQGFELSRSLTSQQAEYAIREEIDEWPGLAEIVWGTDRPYAETHQEGRPPKLPQRMHTGLTAAHVDGMVERAADFLVLKLRGL